RPASGSVFCGSWRRPASRWWPRTCRSRPSAMWRSPATSFVGYRPSGITDRLLGSGRTRRPHAFEQLVDRCLVRRRAYLRRLRLRLLHREQVDHLAPAPHRPLEWLSPISYARGTLVSLNIHGLNVNSRCTSYFLLFCTTLLSVTRRSANPFFF